MGARRLVGEALDRAQHRRDAVPFVGWLRRLVPVQVLLDDARPGAAASAWARQIARSARAHDRTEWGRPGPAAPGDGTAWRPGLTVREQEVLATSHAGRPTATSRPRCT